MENEKDLQSEEIAEETAIPEEETAEASAPEKDGKKKGDKKAKAENLKLKEEIESLTAALEEEKKNRLYLAAEYDNFRRRSQKEKDGIYSDAISDAIKEILPLFDNLERAGQYSGDSEKVAEGLALIAKMSDEVLSKLGVERFGAPGEQFDANIHNAVMHEDNEAFGENEITDVYQVGYKRGDKIIRFAMVKVAN
ncbi:MAG: nucleotide exchange factor GrpE [Ruminococcaceae bacterium]|nr:nucleotide exchange factor GrpE [Oscillospiraceae bacterium]